MKSGKWMSKLHSLMDLLKKSCIWCNHKVFVNPKDANKMCKLQRSIYGLVQASRSWNIRFDELIKAYGFIQTYWETCIYNKVSGSTTAFPISICEWHIVDQKWCRIFLESIKEYLKGVFRRRTSVKLLTYWASRSIEIDQDAW